MKKHAVVDKTAETQGTYTLFFSKEIDIILYYEMEGEKNE